MAQRDENGTELTIRAVCCRSTQGHQQEPAEAETHGSDSKFRNPHAGVAERERRMLPFQDRIERQRDSDCGDSFDQPNQRRRDHPLRVTGDSAQDVVGAQQWCDKCIAEDEGRGRDEKQRAHEHGGSSVRVRGLSHGCSRRFRVDHDLPSLGTRLSAGVEVFTPITSR